MGRPYLVLLLDRDLERRLRFFFFFSRSRFLSRPPRSRSAAREDDDAGGGEGAAWGLRGVGHPSMVPPRPAPSSSGNGEVISGEYHHST